MSKTKGQLRDAHNDLVLDNSRLRAVNGLLLAALEAANLYLLQSPAVDDYYERVLDDVQAAIAEAKKATGTQP